MRKKVVLNGVAVFFMAGFACRLREGKSVSAGYGCGRRAGFKHRT